jgi:hypothetical protein
VKASFDITKLEDKFYSNYTTLVQTIYLEKEPSAYAEDQLGFPSLR